MSNLSRVITFATGKGGTGKTSCAANVAGLAAQAGWRTLLIDLDSQANLGHDLGFSESEGADHGAHLVNTLVTGGTLTPVLTGVRTNLDVIPGGSKLDDLEDLVRGRQRRGEDGRFLWPGFSENSRALAWITERIEGKTSAMESPYGLVPVHAAIDYQAAGVSDEDWDALFAIDAAALSAEADDTDVFLARMGTKVPSAVMRQHEEFRSRL